MIELALDAVLTAVSAIVFVFFARAVRGHFQSARMPLGMMVISVVSLAAFSWFLISVWREAQPLSARLAGLGLQTASLALFLAAIRATRGARLRLAFDRGQSIALIDTGPYRYVRHPFYLSYTVFWIGCAAATISPNSVLFAAVLIGLYATAAYLEEKRFLASSLSEQYADYRRRTGSLWPWT